MSRARVLMAVYNGLAFDGRVQRSAQALSEIADLKVLSLHDGAGWSPPGQTYQVEELPIPLGGAKNIAAFGAALVSRAVRERPALVYAHDYYVAAPGARAARRTGARFVYDAHELNLPAAGESLDARGKFFLALERWGARRADRVICANEMRALKFQEWTGRADLPTVVRNIPPRFEPGPGTTMPPLAATHDGSVRLLYQGDMGAKRGLERWVAAMAHLPSRYHLVMAGAGPALDRLREVALEHRVADRVQFLGRVPRDTLDPLMRVCDIGILSYPAQDLNNVFCAPNKVYEYAQCGLPMVAIGSPHLAEMMEPHGLGRCLGIDADPEAIAGAIASVEDARSASVAACARFADAHPWSSEADTLRAAIRPLLEVVRG